MMQCYDNERGERLCIGGRTQAEHFELVEVMKFLEAQRVQRNAKLESLADSGQILDFMQRNQAWRDSPRAAQVLALSGDLSGNLLRNIVQDLINESQRQARQLNAIWRVLLGERQPALLDASVPLNAGDT